MEGEIVIKRWEDLDGEVSSYRLCCLLSFHFNIILLKLYDSMGSAQHNYMVYTSHAAINIRFWGSVLIAA